MGPARPASAIVFGSPTYMGSTSAGFKSFMDESSDRWVDQVWADKIAGGFTVATYPSGDKQVTLTQLAVFAAQHGMIWVGLDQTGEAEEPQQGGMNSDGYCLGLGARSSRDKTLLIDPGDAATARAFGARITMAARRWGKVGRRARAFGREQANNVAVVDASTAKVRS